MKRGAVKSVLAGDSKLAKMNPDESDFDKFNSFIFPVAGTVSVTGVDDTIPSAVSVLILSFDGNENENVDLTVGLSATIGVIELNKLVCRADTACEPNNDPNTGFDVTPWLF